MFAGKVVRLLRFDELQLACRVFELGSVFCSASARLDKAAGHSDQCLTSPMVFGGTSCLS